MRGPSHFEIAVPDTDRAQEFYGALLGWTFEGTEHGARVQTGGVPGGIHGQGDGAGLQIFYSVPDLEAAAKQVIKLGGEVDEGGEEGPSGRWLFSCRDDQGVPFGLHEPPVA
jgi:predicted enzyme related to lactoylglutathione lyase